MSQVPFGAVKRVVEGAAPYRRGCPRFRQSRNAARTLAARGTAGEQKRIPFLLLTPPPMVEAEKNEARRRRMVGASPKNISSTLRSSETTNDGYPRFWLAKTPPAHWRRGV